MSDRRLLFLAFALVARPLAAQDDLALLRRRVANLEARREVLARAVATISAADSGASSTFDARCFLAAFDTRCFAGAGFAARGGGALPAWVNGSAVIASPAA